MDKGETNRIEGGKYLGDWEGCSLSGVGELFVSDREDCRQDGKSICGRIVA